MKPIFLLMIGGLVGSGMAQEKAPTTARLEKFRPEPAPRYIGMLLKKGDRLAICGDSITEQRMYSRIIEDYLTMCAPELEVQVRQYGWSGERAEGFLARMTNDCLRFKPTIATTCYGMNDHEYRPYEERIGRVYREKSLAVVQAFKANGTRVVLGSPGCVGKMPAWVKTATGTVDDLNLNLCQLRNLDIAIAREQEVRFADVFWPMITAGVLGQERYGTNFAISGPDGVHPTWAGQMVMAYAFLKTLGLDGQIGALTVDLKTGKMKGSEGHEILSGERGRFEIKSSRYPFCACEPPGQTAAGYPNCTSDKVETDASIRAALALIPFNGELNRFVLMVQNAGGNDLKITWGEQSKLFKASQLAAGINLVEEFPANPFGSAFARVDAAVAAKQEYETKQIKQLFHGPEGKADMEGTVTRTEATREPLAKAIKTAFVPVTHKLVIEPQ